MAPLGHIQTPSRRFSHVHVDIIGPLPPASSFKYCLTVIDRFTRWPEVCPLERITAESVTYAFLWCWISRFGRPDKITTDRGSQFTSSLFQNLAKQYGIELHYTTSYHPAANGLVERFHRQLKAAIMAHSEENWIEALPLVLLGIRSAFKDDIKATTAELVYGESLHLPGELVAPPQRNSPVEDPTSLLTRLRRYLSRARPTPASRHAKPGTFIFRDLSKCDHVLLRDDSVRKALQPPYTGPYKVLSRDSKTLTLKMNNGPIKVSIDRAKPAYLLADNEVPNPSASPTTTIAREQNVPVRTPGPDPPATAPEPPADYFTRSGRPVRRVRFPDYVTP